MTMVLPWSHTKYKYDTTTALHPFGMTVRRMFSGDPELYLTGSDTKTSAKAPFLFPQPVSGRKLLMDFAPLS